MFDKLKDLNRLRKAQGEMKKQLEQIFVQQEKGATSVLMRGDKRIEKIVVDGVENKSLKDLINDCMKAVEKKSEKQLRGQLGDFGFPDLGA